MAPILRRATDSVNGYLRRHRPLIPRLHKNLLTNLSPNLHGTAICRLPNANRINTAQPTALKTPNAR